MPDRFVLLVESGPIPYVSVVLPAGWPCRCAGCPTVLTAHTWVHRIDADKPHEAPSVWCTPCVLRTGRVTLLRATPADGADRDWQPDVEPEPEMATIEFPSGVAFRMPKAHVAMMGGARMVGG